MDSVSNMPEHPFPAKIGKCMKVEMNIKQVLYMWNGIWNLKIFAYENHILQI